jgi:hypothetical protein
MMDSVALLIFANTHNSDRGLEGRHMASKRTHSNLVDIAECKLASSFPFNYALLQF